MVVITAKGNPLGIRQVADLVKPEVRFVRVTGEKDLATNRTIDHQRPRRSKENPNWPKNHRRRDGGSVEAQLGAGYDPPSEGRPTPA
jgi:hypothetical protein